MISFLPFSGLRLLAGSLSVLFSLTGLVPPLPSSS